MYILGYNRTLASFFGLSGNRPTDRSVSSSPRALSYILFILLTHLINLLSGDGDLDLICHSKFYETITALISDGSTEPYDGYPITIVRHYCTVSRKIPLP